MIYRFVIETAKRDFVRAAVDRFFQDYLILQADRYKNNIKSMALVVEINGKEDGSDAQTADNARGDLVKTLGIPVSFQVLKTSIEAPKQVAKPVQPKKEEKI